LPSKIARIRNAPDAPFESPMESVPDPATRVVTAILPTRGSTTRCIFDDSSTHDGAMQLGMVVGLATGGPLTVPLHAATTAAANSVVKAKIERNLKYFIAVPAAFSGAPSATLVA
jgi:hypothetical protein